MTTTRNFVLVHGGWHGGWCWSRVVDRLTQAGHRTFAPSLTGLGDRRHLLSAQVDLNTHVDDIVNLIEAEELRDVVLVAHSYGGIPATGARCLVADRIDRFVYFDAIIGQPGKSRMDGLTPEVARMRLSTLIDVDGVKVAAPWPAEFFGVTDEADAAWVNRRVTPQPALTWTSALPPAAPLHRKRPDIFVRCVKPPIALVNDSHRLAQDMGMDIMELEACHDAMVTDPDAVAALLLKIAGSQAGR
jgi:pimeloyl-ACP methyl ester carboxylesterase